MVVRAKRVKKGQELDYHITTQDGLTGARLCLAGEYGNIHHPNTEAASAAASKEANGRPMKITRKHYQAHVL